MPRHLPSCLLKVKSDLSGSIVDFYKDLNLNKVRFLRPSKEIFLCGGLISPTDTPNPKSVRDYIYRLLQQDNPLGAKLILAEKANHLYRSTTYGDLITFEEHIAKLVALIVVITESPSGLAELGAFASIPDVSEKLILIVRHHHADDESFIRYGPIDRIDKKGDGLVGFFPWTVNEEQAPVIETLNLYKDDIISFIKENLTKVPASKSFSNLGNEEKKLFTIYWIIFIAYAIPQGQIHEITQAIGLDITQVEIRNILFSLQLVGWVSHERYSKEYYYTVYDKDPFDYSFNSGVTTVNSLWRKIEIAKESREKGLVPKFIRAIVASKRVKQ
jgi:hypothetical protein